MSEQKTLFFLSNHQKSDIYKIIATYLEAGLKISEAVLAIKLVYKEDLIPNNKYLFDVISRLDNNLKDVGKQKIDCFEEAFEVLTIEEKIYLQGILLLESETYCMMGPVDIKKNQAIIFKEISKILLDNKVI